LTFFSDKVSAMPVFRSLWKGSADYMKYSLMANNKMILAASLGVMLSAMVTNASGAQDATDAVSDAPAKVPTLWTAPSYAVKPVAPKSANPNVKVPSYSYGNPDVDNTENKSKDPLTDALKPTDETVTVSHHGRMLKLRKKSKKKEEVVTAKVSSYDAEAAQKFESGNAQPQYLWTSKAQSTAPKGQATASAAIQEYYKTISDKIAENLKVPSRANLVESSDKKYNYVIGFSLLKSGQVVNVQVLDQVGNIATVPLADDQESSMIVQALTSAIKKSAPIAAPPAGLAPWNMLASYDVTSGKMFTVCLNSH